eukprot:CAMPEP_0177727436 /NCGR_PEP_ID=MMETSP0484_2-20121128/20321_1 /TAXON_ID=354590 /ORGANISM="Rhodomonas lens, Strain RHODO" /LENGTH=72 /DNA_ID=CAMNT_0019240091 /DNA_START=97 /DNA_END=312 /DNA_ORIENTATION=+
MAVDNAVEWSLVEVFEMVVKRLFAAAIALLSVSFGWFIMWKLVLQKIPFIRDLVLNRPPLPTGGGGGGGGGG